MSEDNTKELTDGEKLNRILAELAGMNDRLGALESTVATVGTRLGALEAQAEDRARETRPKLDLIIKEVADVRADIGELKDGQRQTEKELRAIGRRFEIFSEDHMKMRAHLRDFDERLTELESRPN